MSRDEIPPGGEGEIKVEFSTKNNPGRVIKTIKVMTDDRVTPVAELHLSAEVVVLVGFEKQRLYFKRLITGETERQRVEILVREPEKIEFGQVVTSAKNIQASVIKVKEKGANGKPKYFLDLTFKPEELGPVREYVKVSTSDEKIKDITLPLSGVVVPHIMVNPDHLSMRTRGPWDVEKNLIIRTMKEEFRIKEVNDASGRIKASVKALRPGAIYQISVNLTEKGLKDKEGFSAVLTITTDSKFQPVLEVPVLVKAVSRS